MFKLAKKDQKGQIDTGNSNQNYWWEGGLKLTFQLFGWLVGSLIFSLFLGKWLDNRYQTKPWLFLLCVGIAFLVTSLGIVKETIVFIKKIEKEAEIKKKLNNPVKKEDDRKQ